MKDLLYRGAVAEIDSAGQFQGSSMKMKLFAACAAVSIVAAASPAAARMFDFTAVSANFTVTGTFTTSQNANKTGYDGNTGYLINDITGMVNNNPITGLLAPGSYPTTGVSNDNILKTDDPYLDLAGFSFTISGGPSPINIYYDGGYDYIRGMNGQNTGTITSFTVTPAGGAGAVPEPATWAMLVSGFGLVGAGMRRRSGRVVQAI